MFMSGDRVCVRGESCTVVFDYDPLLCLGELVLIEYDNGRRLWTPLDLVTRGFNEMVEDNTVDGAETNASDIEIPVDVVCGILNASGAYPGGFAINEGRLYHYYGGEPASGFEVKPWAVAGWLGKCLSSIRVNRSKAAELFALAREV